MLMIFSSATWSMYEVGVPSAPILISVPPSSVPTYSLTAGPTALIISFAKFLAIFLVLLSIFITLQYHYLNKQRRIQLMQCFQQWLMSIQQLNL